MKAFLLRNRTGEPVWFWLGDASGGEGGRTRVGPNEEDVSFGFEHLKGEGKGPRREYTRARVVNIEVGDDQVGGVDGGSTDDVPRRSTTPCLRSR
jgi:hypothetical protein